MHAPTSPPPARPLTPSGERHPVSSPRAESREPRALPSPGALAVALVALILGFLPIPNWIAGGDGDPEFWIHVSEWTSGSAIAIGVGLILALGARQRPALWRSGLAERFGAAVARHPRRFDAIVVVASFALYLAIGWFVFDGRPLLVDEIAQTLQARIFASGRLTMPLPAHPEFFSTLQMVEHQGRTFSQFPPGGPAAIALGALVGATWIVGPLFGALAVWAFAALARRVEPRPAVAAGATVLFALAPFTAFMAGSHMNHVPTLTCLVLAMLGLAIATGSDRAHPLAALASGLGFGLAATIRPVDAATFALPAGAWFLWRTVRDWRRWPELVASGVGVALPLLGMLWFNLRTTGHPLLSGYELLWGAGHNLGFHANPWGLPHTPARGLQYVALYFLRLQRFLFETPIPSLVPVIGALALTPRRLSPFDRYLVASGALLVGGYWAYWHDGFYLGPRFVYSLIPALVLFAARFPGRLRDAIGTERADRSLGYRTAIYALCVSAAIALFVSVPLRVRQYASSFPVQRWNAAPAARAAGADGALVFVRESWEAQMVVRMWALGVSHAEAEQTYRAVDACTLDQALRRLERTPASQRPDVRRVLEPLLADSMQVVRQKLSTAAYIHVRPGARYDATCIARAQETAGGVMPLAPLLATASPADSTIYARDLGSRDSLLLAAYPHRRVFLLHPADPAHDALPVFRPLDRDSLRAAWAAEP